MVISQFKSRKPDILALSIHTTYAIFAINRPFRSSISFAIIKLKMAPNKKATVTHNATSDAATTFKHDIKDLVKKVEILSADCKITQGHGLRLDDQGKRQDDQGIALVQCRDELGTLKSDVLKLKADVAGHSQKFKDDRAAVKESSVDSLQASISQQPMIMVPLRQWDDLVSSKKALNESLDTLTAESNKLTLKTQEIVTQAENADRTFRQIKDALDQDNDRLRTENDAVADELRHLSSEYAELQTRIPEHQEERSELEEDKQQLLNENTKLQTMMKENRESRNKAEEDRQELLRDYTRLEKDVQHLLRVKKRLGKENGQLQKEIVAFQKEVERLWEEPEEMFCDDEDEGS